MPLAERPGICKKLQFLMADNALSTWFQDSRFKAQTKLLGSNLSGFKIQDARFKAEAPLDLRSFFRSRILNLESDAGKVGMATKLQTKTMFDPKKQKLSFEVRNVFKRPCKYRNLCLKGGS